jgi:hypothetical protein
VSQISGSLTFDVELRRAAAEVAAQVIAALQEAQFAELVARRVVQMQAAAPHAGSHVYERTDPEQGPPPPLGDEVGGYPLGGRRHRAEH